MGNTTTKSNSLAPSRTRGFIVPREHGAWGMLLVPLVTGAAAGHPHGERIAWILLFAAAAMALFCVRTPVEAQLGLSALRPQNHRERKLIYFFIFSYASVACLSLAALMLWARAYNLLLLGAAAAIALLLQTLLKRAGRSARMSAQLVGAIALSSTAAGAYYLATGHLGAAAAIVWLANWLLAANQIHFVQLRIHSAHASERGEKFHQGRGFLLHQAACLLLLGAMWRAGWLPGLVLMAFTPLLVRGSAWFLTPPRPLQIHRLGVRELVYAVVFGMFFVVGYHPIG